MRTLLSQLNPKMREKAIAQLKGLRVGATIRTRSTREDERQDRVMAASEPEERLAQHLEAYGITYSREFRFHAERRWRFDFALVDQRIAIEVDGGTHSGGRHVRGEGYERDCQKLAAAVLEGWRVFRFTTAMVRSGMAIDTIRAALGPFEGSTGKREGLT